MQDYTHLDQAQRVRDTLAKLLQALKTLERDLKRRPSPTAIEHMRPDRVAVAIEEVQLAMDAIEMAGRE